MAVDRVRIEGNHAVSASDIVDRMATSPSPRFLGLVEGFLHDYALLDRSVLQRDLERVERYYRARGHYETRVRAGRVLPNGDAHADVTVVVEEDRPVLIREARVEGLTGLAPEDAEAVRAAMAQWVKPGQPFEEAPFREAERSMRRALTDRGRAWASVARRADVDLPGHFAVLFFAVRPGPEAVFGPVRIEGLDGIPDAPVRRAIDVAPDEPYSTTALDHAQRAVLDLGAFSSVEITPELGERPSPRGVVPVLVRVQLQKLAAVSLGGGVELDALRAEAHFHLGWEHKNLLGGLRHFTVDLRPGVILFPTRLPGLEAPTDVLLEERLRAELRQPGLLEARTTGVLRQELDTYPVQLSSVVDPTASVLGYLEYKGALGVERSRGKLFGASTYQVQVDHPFTYKGPLDPRFRDLVLSYVEVLGQLDLRDDRLRPHAGVLLQGDLQVAGLGGDARDVRLQPEVRGYVPIAGGVTLAARATVGLLFPLDYGDAAGAESGAGARDLELRTLRGFFSGGPSSNRGYPLRSIGPHGPVSFFNPGLPACALGSHEARCAVALGGLSLWEASLELRFPIHGPFGGSTFCDASDVSARRLDLRLDYPHLSCGLGLRYDTPIGPVRLDVGYRIPGAQIPRGADPRVDADPETLQGLPLAVSVGIGEAF